MYHGMECFDYLLQRTMPSFHYSFKLTYQTFEDSPLDHVHSGGHGLETDSGDEEMGFDMGVAKVGPSPFSQRRDKVLFDCSDKVMW